MNLNLRARKMTNASTTSVKDTPTENIALQQRNYELENLVVSLRQQLDIVRSREKKLTSKLDEIGYSLSTDIEMQSATISSSTTELGRCPIEPHISFASSVFERGGWLVGLLIFQSFSSIILSSNESLLQNHPTIIYFLTMLVGAGGNAGNQAAVRVIRGIALGQINRASLFHFAYREFLMSCTLSCLLGVCGFLRALVSDQTSLSETFAIVVALMVIVFFSIIMGAMLPLLLHACRIDPAHSSTSIQVIMDISGVLFTCSISTFLLDTIAGKLLLSKLGILF